MPFYDPNLIVKIVEWLWLAFTIPMIWMFNQIAKIKEKSHEKEVEFLQTFATKDDLRAISDKIDKLHDMINSKLDHITDKLDQKADK